MSEGKSKKFISDFVEKTKNKLTVALTLTIPPSYVDLESDLKVNVYLAAPYSSLQRGTNKNTNGLIREFFPKKFDFSTITQKEVDIVEGYLNNRPRKCLWYKTPLEVFNEGQAKCCT